MPLRSPRHGSHRLTQDYIKSLVDLFVQAEDLERIEVLHALCTCMQTIRASVCAPPRSRKADRMVVMLNDHSMYEHILDDDAFFGVVGMLECPSCYFLSCETLLIPVR